MVVDQGPECCRPFWLSFLADSAVLEAFRKDRRVAVVVVQSTISRPPLSIASRLLAKAGTKAVAPPGSGSTIKGGDCSAGQPVAGISLPR